MKTVEINKVTILRLDINANIKNIGKAAMM
jgi:hypothetical protein